MNRPVVAMFTVWVLLFSGQVLCCFYANVTSFVEYVPGNGDVIISVSHGGYPLDERIHDRVPGCWEQSRCNWDYSCKVKDKKRCPVRKIGDLRTIDLSRYLAENLRRLTGKQPHLILNHLSRMQMDANRPRDQGTGNDPYAGAVWDDFQNYIKLAKCFVKGGLYLDILGHGHPEGNIELGYRINKTDLNAGNYRPEDSTIRHLVLKTGLNLITGSKSLGAFLQNLGYSSVPSPAIKSPGDAKYFRGGYNVLQHGSLHGGNIDGIQIEVPRKLRSRKRVREFAAELAKAVSEFLKLRG